MNEPISLAQALQRAAQDLHTAQPPAHLLATVRAHWQAGAGASAPAWSNTSADGGHPRPRPPQAWWRPDRVRAWAWPGAAALALALVGSVVLLRPPPAAAPAAEESRFVNLVPAERWPREASAAWLVRTELTSDRLAALGLPFDPAQAGQPLRAEMLMRSTGEVLAVRFVP